MGIKTTYTCDRCNEEHSKQDDMFEVHAKLVPYSMAYRNETFQPPAKALWCRKCCEEFEPLLSRPKTNKPAEPQKDLAELIRELIREEAYEAASEAVQNHMRA